jgi:hypothetical protein
MEILFVSTVAALKASDAMMAMYLDTNVRALSRLSTGIEYHRCSMMLAWERRW